MGKSETPEVKVNEKANLFEFGEAEYETYRRFSPKGKSMPPWHELMADPTQQDEVNAWVMSGLAGVKRFMGRDRDFDIRALETAQAHAFASGYPNLISKLVAFYFCMLRHEAADEGILLEVPDYRIKGGCKSASEL